MNKRFFNPFILTSLYALSPSVPAFGFVVSPGDIYLSFCISLLLFKDPIHVSGNNLRWIKYFLVFVALASGSFLLSSFFYNSIQFYWFPIILRPTLFCFFLHLYFTRLGLPSRSSFIHFLWFSTLLIFLFSLYILINVGFSFSHDQIWSYSPTTRLVGLRGIVLGRSFEDFEGNDSVNFSIFVCLIATYHLAVFKTLSLNSRFVHLACSFTLFCLSSLSLSKSSYVFIACLVFVYLLHIARTLLIRHTSNISFFVFLFITPFLLSIIPADIMSTLFPRLTNMSISDIFTDPSSQARVSMIQPFLKDLDSNPFLSITGRGAGMLHSAYSVPHFEGLFLTTFAELGIILMLYLFFVIYHLFHPSVYRKSSPISVFLRLSFFPFLVVSVFSSLTIYSTLLYPLLFTSSILTLLPSPPFDCLSSSPVTSNSSFP